MSQATIQQAFDLAVQHHQSGRPREAEQLYRHILARQPSHVGAMHYLGLLAYQQGRNDIAVELIRRAIALNPSLPDAHSNLGLVLKEIGQLDEAIASYRQALALSPNFPNALFNLGVALQCQGRLDQAVTAYKQTIALQADHFAAHNNLGICLMEQGQIDDSIVAYRKALCLKPNLAQARSNLGNALSEKGEVTQAIVEYRAALLLDPALPDAWNNLGNALQRTEELEEAAAAYRKAIDLKPDYVEAHNNLGNALRGRGQLEEARAALSRAIELKPNFAHALNNLGNVLKDLGRTDEAIAACRRAIAFDPELSEAFNNLANALSDKGEMDEAIAVCRRAIDLNSKLALAHNNLGNLLKSSGRLDGAIAAYREALSLAPGDSQIHSNLVYALYFHPGYDAKAIADEHRRWNTEHAEPLRKFIQPHSNDRDPDRRLRIGYVSPDFRNHVVGQNLLPLIREHDRGQFHITCYAQVARPDAITSQLQQQADTWRSIIGQSDEQVANQIRDDQIDVLVDLTLHMANNRLLVFARRPAPVQATYLGYCGTSGMSAMDYRFSDPYLDPQGTDLSCYSETTLHLPRTYWCYQPGGSAPEPAPAPALKNGFITFGCLNNFAKVTPASLDLWTRILVKVSNSWLMIHNLPGTHRTEVVQRLEHAGVANGRIRFIGSQPWATHVQSYSDIDIALDPFPYAGGITTCNALWMGVPVVTLSGDTAVGRGGRSILSNLGLPELIAFSPEQYLQIAIELAGDQDRMNEIRSNLRARMLASPLLDAKALARDVEAAYRQMWRAWCATADAKG